MPNGAYAVTAGAAGGKTIIVAAAERGSNGKLSAGFRIGAGNMGKGGTKGNREVNGLIGAKKGLIGAQNGSKKGSCAEHGLAEPRINANKQTPNKINTEIFNILIFMITYPLLSMSHYCSK